VNLAHPPQSSAEIKNAWSYTSTPQYIFIVWYLVKARYNFTFTISNNNMDDARTYEVGVTLD